MILTNISNTDWNRMSFEDKHNAIIQEDIYIDAINYERNKRKYKMCAVVVEDYLDIEEETDFEIAFDINDIEC